jgi:hypothetical protein
VVGHDQFCFECELRSQAVTCRTGPEGVVEGKQPGFDFRNGETGNGTGEFFRKDNTFVRFILVLQHRARLRCIQRLVGEFRNRDTVGEPQSGLEGIRQTAGNVFAHHDPVHDHVYVVLEFLVESRGLGDFVEFAVDLDPLKALFHEFGEFLAVLALAAAYDRGQQVKTCAFLKLQDPVDHLGNGLALDRQAGCRRVGDPDAREQKAHIVVDFRDRPDRGTRIPGSGLLFDGNGR